MSDQSNPNEPYSAYPTQPGVQYPGGPPGQPPESNTKWYLLVAGLLVVIAGLLAVAFNVLPFDSDDQAETATYVVVDQPPTAPVFEPAGSGGQDPFFPLTLQLAGFEQETGQAADPTAVTNGLYGGTAENTCDPQRLIDFLLANPAKGQAWARVQNISFEEIPDYINSLSIRVLAAPTTVLNHGFNEATSSPYEIESTLAAGTAVLVDADGDVRTRCYCGNPIKPKPIGHRPPRCLLLTQSVFTEPRSGTSRDDVTSDVVLTGRVTSDLAWTEVAWGAMTEAETGWTPSENVSQGYCMPEVVLPPPATAVPTAFATATPVPLATVTPPPLATVTPAPIPTLAPPPSPAPTTAPTTLPTPLPTVAPTPTSTPTPSPSPSATPTAAPLQLEMSCSISNVRPGVGEQFTITGRIVPDDPEVTLNIHHGDGTIDPNNPSFAFYEQPGSYEVRLIASKNGQTQELFCGTVTVTGNPCEFVQVVGLTEDAAASAAASQGCTTRVVHRDGEDFSVTQDFRLDRINLWINSGVVFQSSVG